MICTGGLTFLIITFFLLLEASFVSLLWKPPCYMFLILCLSFKKKNLLFSFLKLWSCFQDWSILEAIHHQWFYKGSCVFFEALVLEESLAHYNLIIDGIDKTISKTWDLELGDLAYLCRYKEKSNSWCDTLPYSKQSILATHLRDYLFCYLWSPSHQLFWIHLHILFATI